MKRYEDYKRKKNGQPYKHKTQRELTRDEIKSIEWTKYKIVVPTEGDKNEVLEALRHMHYGDIDTDYVTVNQLAHEYLDGVNVIVDPNLYNTLNS